MLPGNANSARCRNPGAGDWGVAGFSALVLLTRPRPLHSYAETRGCRGSAQARSGPRPVVETAPLLVNYLLCDLMPDSTDGMQRGGQSERPRNGGWSPCSTTMQ